MLDIITKSKIRQRIIALFLYNQDKSYYLSEIAQLVQTSAGTAQRELNRLVEQDIVSIDMRGVHKLYSLNKSYMFLPEFESVFQKITGIENSLSRALKDLKGIEFAFIFGSYVKGGFKSSSDIDLYIIGDADEDRIYKAIEKIEKEYNRTVNYHISEREEFADKKEKEYFYREILGQYRLIIGNEDEFRKSFE